MVDLFHTVLSLASMTELGTRVDLHSQDSIVLDSKGAISTDHLSSVLSTFLVSYINSKCNESEFM
jgi:hypothetical protein